MTSSKPGGDDTRDVLARFSPATRAWFTGAFDAPTTAQAGAWRAIAAGHHTLVVAPTGSGKTLSAFLWSLDRLATRPVPEDRRRRCRVVYVSPLKALAVDVERNLRSPLSGLRQASRRLGLPEPDIRVAVRSGDTPADERRRFGAKPPDILITTPESLFLLLTSRAREALHAVETVIVDEVHAVAGTKRGSHLALSLERLHALLDAPAQRIGLSATVRPVNEVAEFLGGTGCRPVPASDASVDDGPGPAATAKAGSGRPRDGRGPVVIVQPPHDKTIELDITVPVEDMSEPGAAAAGPDGVLEDPRRRSIWPHVEDRLLDLIESHRSTIVFANSRRLSERLCARLNDLAFERLTGGSPDDPDAPPLDGRWPDGGPGDGFPDRSRDRLTDRSPEGLATGGGHGAHARPDRVGAWGSDGGEPPAQVMAQAGASAGAVPEVARAHHGSVSKQERAAIEDALKQGRLPSVVATSSLELGIDMGAVDLVVQVESPPSVASGLQRVGRAGHQVGAVSRGVIFPKYRGDLLQTAVVAERMKAGQIEELHYPRNPLDVLAQQIVTMAAMDEWALDDLEALVRGAAPFATLPRSAFEAVLDMLAGRYPSAEFGELRPRLVWDRVAGTVRGRPGAQRLAVTSGGTIPDRGLFGVFLVGDNASRVGELDEEMVYESRVGDVFVLGATSWRIEDITPDRVLVSPAAGRPGRLPFWKGDTPGRPAELGRALGAFTRELAGLEPSAARERVRRAGLDDNAAGNLLAYLAEQREATGYIPDDRTLVAERFRDELGDWRLVLHSPYGALVHAPWALAISARLRERYGVDAQAMHSDDGIVVRIPETDEPPTAALAVFEPDEIERIVVDELGGSALFAARFRECAARSLLLPRHRPGRRMPLWQQRQRAAQLLAVAGKYASFPIILETVRECLQDVFDVPALVDLMRSLTARRVRLVEVETPQPSPYARSLLFRYVGAFVYEGDSPLAERRAQALTLDSALLAELLGQAELRELLDPEVIAEAERELQRLAEDRRARDVEGVADLLRELGPLTTAEAAERGASEAMLAELEATRRAIRMRIAGTERWAAIEDAGRLRDALGAALPVGIPEAFLEPVPDPLGDLVARHACTHTPFRPADVAARFGLGVAVATEALRRLAATGRVVEGEFLPGGRGVEWCDAGVLRMLRRRSLARLRSEVEPSPPEALGRFLPVWHHVGHVLSVPDGDGRANGAGAGTGARTRIGRAGSLHGIDALVQAIEQLQGAPVPASALESLVLPARVAGYTPAMLDELTASGEVQWAGHGVLPGNDGWVALYLSDTGPLLMPEPTEITMTPTHERVLEVLGDGAALFFRALSDRVGSTDDMELVTVLWDLVWAGHLTNDTLAPLRTRLGTGRTTHRPRGRRRRAALPSRAGPPTAAGRWWMLPPRETDPTRRLHTYAEVLLDRYGIVTRGAVAAEHSPGGFAAVYPVLRAREESGRCRRGYFVEGLGAAQFALPGAVDRLRACRGDREGVGPPGWSPDSWPGAGEAGRTKAQASTVVLAATDPANPYGAALPWPEAPGGHRPGRKAGAVVVLVDGHLVLYVERGGRTLLSWSEDPARLGPAVDALALAVRDGALGKLTVERADGASINESPLGAALLAAGFHPTPRGLRLRA